MEHVRLYITGQSMYLTDDANRLVKDRNVVLVDGSSCVYSKDALRLGTRVLEKRETLLKMPGFVLEELPVVMRLKLISADAFHKIKQEYDEAMSRYNAEIINLCTAARGRMRAETAKLPNNDVRQHNYEVCKLKTKTEKLIDEQRVKIKKPSLEEMLL